MCRRIATLLTIFLGCSVSYAEDSVGIPLSEIWALRMPGTRDVEKLELEAYGSEARALLETEQFERINTSNIQQIRNSLDLEPNSDAPGLKKPGKAFAVVGTGRKALTEAKEILSDHKKPESSFSANSTLSIVFYSLQTGSYVHLTSVKRQGNRIRIHFQFVPHFTDDMSDHFSLIPLPALSAGRYQVNIVEDPLKDYKAWGANQFNPQWRAKYVCKDFEFDVD